MEEDASAETNQPASQPTVASAAPVTLSTSAPAVAVDVALLSVPLVTPLTSTLI